MPDHSYRPPTIDQRDQWLQQANTAQTEPSPRGRYCHLLIARDAPGHIDSPAGVGVMVSVKGLTVNGTALATWLAKKVMAIMSGEETPSV
ncbi:MULTISPECIES: hypothetical protein [unclassified Serratia (in: enterobacteria)]|uniref:hypothetical protein n=1 Tax=unclassified Serratia (in: enterobacteria) TaxID=2647522 RepID=UPI002ED27A6F|nr:hypothetical protein [Serratia sp. C2(2)]MEE4448335.1 hypothetical protein [Serratia sp. C2(1)]